MNEPNEAAAILETRAEQPSHPSPNGDSPPLARLKDVSFIFLIKRENFFAGTIPSWEILFMFHLIPSAAARASFGSIYFLCLSSSPSPSPLLFLVPHPLRQHQPEPVRRGGGMRLSWLRLGWTFNPGMLLHCQHPAPSERLHQVFN